MSRNGNTTPPVPLDPEKAKRVKAEYKRLSDLFTGIDENKRDFVQPQIKQLAWLNISIRDLQDRIDQFGTLVQYDHGGGQSGVTTNPEVKIMNEYQKLATSITRTLHTIVPVKEIAKTDKLASFFDDLDLDNV